MKVVVRTRDAASRLKNAGNFSRKCLGNSKLYLIAITDLTLPGICAVMRACLLIRVRKRRNDAKSRLSYQEFFKTPARWNFRCDDDLPKAAAPISGSSQPACAQSQAHGRRGLLQRVATALR